MTHQISLTACAIVLTSAGTLAGVFPIPLPDGLDYAAHADCHANTAKAKIDSGPRQWLAVGLKGGQHLAWSDHDTLEWDFTGENLDVFFRQGDRPLSYVIDGQAVTGKTPPGNRSVYRLPPLASGQHRLTLHKPAAPQEIYALCAWADLPHPARLTSRPILLPEGATRVRAECSGGQAEVVQQGHLATVTVQFQATLTDLTLKWDGEGEAGFAPVRLHSPATDLEVWTADNLTKVLPDSKPSANTPAHLDLYGAAGETVTAQIVLRTTRPDGPIAKITASFPDTVARLEAWFQDFVPLDFNSAHLETAHRIVNAPALVPDPLRLHGAAPLCPNQSRPVWLRFTIPALAPPGQAEGSIRIALPDGVTFVPVTLDIKPFALPPPGTFGLYSQASAFHFWEIAGDLFELHDPLRSGDPEPEWWSLFDHCLDLMHDQRQNIVEYSWAYLFPGLINSRQDDQGRWSFDYDLFDACYGRIFKRFADMPHFRVTIPFEYGIRNPQAAFHFNDPKRRIPVWADYERGVTTPEAEAYLAALLPDFERHLQKRGWMGRLFFRIGDEPDDDHIQKYRSAVATLRRFMPSVLIQESFCRTEPARALINDVDMGVVHIGQLARLLPVLQERLAQSRAAGVYTTSSAGHLLGAFLDAHPLKIRLKPWLCYLYGFTFNNDYGWYASKNIDPAIYPSLPMNAMSCPGEYAKVYPDQFRRTVHPSLRTEIMRDSRQDYDALALLEKANRDAMARLDLTENDYDPRSDSRFFCRELIPSLEAFTTSPEQFAKIRKILYDTLAGALSEPPALVQTSPDNADPIEAGLVEVRVLTIPGALVTVNGLPAPAGKATVWLTDTSRLLTIEVNGKRTHKLFRVKNDATRDFAAALRRFSNYDRDADAFRNVLKNYQDAIQRLDMTAANAIRQRLPSLRAEAEALYVRQHLNHVFRRLTGDLRTDALDQVRQLLADGKTAEAAMLTDRLAQLSQSRYAEPETGALAVPGRHAGQPAWRLANRFFHAIILEDTLRLVSLTTAAGECLRQAQPGEPDYFGGLEEMYGRTTPANSPGGWHVRLLVDSAARVVLRARRADANESLERQLTVFADYPGLCSDITMTAGNLTTWDVRWRTHAKFALGGRPEGNDFIVPTAALRHAQFIPQKPYFSERVQLAEPYAGVFSAAARSAVFFRLPAAARELTLWGDASFYTFDPWIEERHANAIGKTISFQYDLVVLNQVATRDEALEAFRKTARPEAKAVPAVALPLLTDIQDTMRNVNTELLGQASWTDDGLFFDGKSTCVRLAESPHLWLTHPFTLEMEIKRAEASRDTAMVPWSRTRAEGSMWMHPGANHANVVMPTTASMYPKEVAFTVELPPGTEWMRLAFVYDGEYHRAYLNGRLIKELSQPGNLGGDTPNGLLIGAYSGRDGPRAFFHGWIRQVKVWHEALPPEQLAMPFAGPETSR